MAKLVTLTIDGQALQVPETTLIVDAAKQIGVDIPVFCYHPKMEPVGMCRMCLVEIGRPLRDRATGELVREADGSPKIQFGPKLETACTTPVSEGMAVVTRSEKVAAARKDVIEFLLTSHPLDCPICDKGGECPLQNLTMGYGSGHSRYIYDEKQHLGKHVPLGEMIMLDRERCIQCGRCVRFQDEIVDDPVIGFFNRGRSLEIVTFSEPGFDSIFSGNTTDICPVGALTTVDFRFEARPWEMNASPSICPHCPVGCNTTINQRREARAGGGFVIKRVMPRQNEQVNEIWLCDKGRFGYQYAQSPERLKEPLVRQNGELAPASWDEALQAAADGLRQAGKNLLALGSGRLSNEDLFNLRMLAGKLGGQAALYGSMGGGDLMAQVGVGQGTDLGKLGKGDAVLVVACDLHEEAPIWWLRLKQAARRGASLIVVNPRPTKIEKYASHTVRYEYDTAGASAAQAVLALVNSLSTKRPDTGLPQGAAFKAAAEAAAHAFSQAANAIVIYGSEGLGLPGSQALAQACANLLISTGHTGRPNNGLMAAWPNANTQGAWDMGFRPHEDLRGALQSAGAVYVAAADPAGDDAALAAAIDAAGFVIVQDLVLTETARRADVVLPAQPFAEREGTYTSGDRRVQRYYPALPGSGSSRSDFELFALVAKNLGLELEGGGASLVMSQIAHHIPAYNGISYGKLAETAEQWPIVGRRDLYYGGTTYENKQGLGVQLAAGGQPSLAWPQLPQAEKPAAGLLAVPVTRLYDQGSTLGASKLLKARIPAPHVAINTAEAGRLGIRQGDAVQMRLAGLPESSYPVVSAFLSEAVPAGVVLAPRSFGIPLTEPAAVELRLVEMAKA